MTAETFVGFVGDNTLLLALAAGFVIAFLNLLGALIVLVWRNPSEKSLDTMLGFAAGIMLAASFTSLILPGIEEAGGNPIPVLVGIVLGVVLLDRADRWVPHVHFLVTGKKRDDQTKTTDGVDPSKVGGVILFIVAITLHNMPEGLAVGVGFGSGDYANAVALMLAIGIQNIPEGFAVSVAAVNAGFDRKFYAALTGVRSGLVEIPLVVIGAYAVSVSQPILPYAMGFAAGGMLYVISDEIIPETHTRGYERVATLGTMAGVVVMLYLDVSLG